MKHDRWVCRVCKTICTAAQMLRAANPFDPGDELTGCPKCKAPDSFEAACAFEGCEKTASCGGPGDDGVYRHTCGAHAAWLHKT